MNSEPQYYYDPSRENNQVENLDQRIWGIRPFSLDHFLGLFPLDHFLDLPSFGDHIGGEAHF